MSEEILIDDAETVIKSIREGEYDTHLDAIANVAYQRKRHLALQQGWTLQVGDRVEFHTGRPRYLIGEKATITKVMQSWVLLKLDRSVGKFSNLSTIRTPMTIIRKIKE